MTLMISPNKKEKLESHDSITHHHQRRPVHQQVMITGQLHKVPRDRERRAYSGKHNSTYTREYRRWAKMKARCLNKGHVGYKDYGGRGINVCDRWLKFENFLADMGPLPSLNHSIDRIDVDGNYEPSNCRWATKSQQRNNTRQTLWFEYQGRKHSLKEWFREFKSKGLEVTYTTIRERLKAGWSFEETFTTPRQKSRWGIKKIRNQKK